MLRDVLFFRVIKLSPFFYLPASFPWACRKERERKEQKQDAGFSVAFGSTGRSASAGRRAPFAPLARTLSGGYTNS